MKLPARGLYHCVMCGNGYSQVMNGQVVREWCHCTELHPGRYDLARREKMNVPDPNYCPNVECVFKEGSPTWNAVKQGRFVCCNDPVFANEFWNLGPCAVDDLRPSPSHPENMLLHNEEKDDERSEQKPSDPV